MQSLDEPSFFLPFQASLVRNCFLNRRRSSGNWITGPNPGLDSGILGLHSACGKPHPERRFTRLAHERASGELSYSENRFEKLSFAVPCSFR